MEAFGSSPGSCVIDQPEFRQSALGKRNVWCALVFSSNCSVAHSARKIFQNKAIDGNYISTWGTDGMWIFQCFVKNTPQSDRYVSSWPAGAASGSGDGEALGAHLGPMGSRETSAQAGSSPLGGLSWKLVDFGVPWNCLICLTL